MIDAIVGDIAGSPYEFHNVKTPDLPNRRWDIDGMFLSWICRRDRQNAGKLRLPANVALYVKSADLPAGILVQRNRDERWQRENVFRLSLDDDPVVDGDTGDLTPDEIAVLKAFVRRNRDLIRAHWDETADSSVVLRLSFDEP